MKLMKKKENKKELRKKNKKKNEVKDDDGIKTINAHTFPMHLHLNATGDSIIRSDMKKPFDTFRIMLKQIGLEDFFRNSCFGHFLDLPEKNNARFQMTMVYKLLNRRFISQNPENKDEVLINYCGIPLFFGKRGFAIVSGLKCHPPSESIPEFIVKKEPRRRKNGEKEETRQSTEEQDLVSLGHESFELTVEDLLKPLGPKTNNLFVFPWAFMAWAFEVIPYLRHQKMTYLITLGLVETLFDPVVDRVKMELAGARTIKRERVDNELVVFDGVDGVGIDDGSGVDGGGDIGVAAGQDQGATSYRRCSGFLCERCKKQDEDAIMYLQTLSQAKRRKKFFIKAIQNLKKKIFGELPMAVGEKALEFKHVNVYNRENFRTMTSMKIWWEDWYIDKILTLMRERHVRYHEYYDSIDRILDLNFYSNFKQRYDKMSEEATTVDPLHEGRMNVYDCQLMGMEHAKFLTFIQLVFELLLNFLKQSGIMKHLPDKFLNVPWEFEGRLEPMVTNESKAVGGSYSLAFIEHLITMTTIQPPQTLLCDNTVGRMQ
ncbi:hypothetical protein H5410_002987 [Solanum commersonii]|uniref:Uncharacterized protein n=1 Tax=Solanum commersonii TaxID=4109 RepID=A0A9J6B3G0_SOLCO|nr:hypothetical protein H5410_002987 [Solanum commersonii]